MTFADVLYGATGGLLQFGHDSSPWMTTTPSLYATANIYASIRPRLIAVDDLNETVTFVGEWVTLQFGHDSSPWMT